MRFRSTLLVLVVALAGSGATCRSAPKQEAVAAPPGDVDLPGVDTTDFTLREKHELSRLATTMPWPCPSSAAKAPSIAECLTEKRPCPLCLGAAKMIAKAVRDGLGRAQVEDLYKQRFDVASLKTIPLDGSPVRGLESAPVVIVEFADFECPYCQKLAPELDALWEKHKDEVRFVYKFLPLAMHAHGEPAARAAIAAQMQGKFWEMHHELFASGQHLEPKDLEGYAKALGLDLERFRVDMRSPAATDRIESDRKLADGLGIKGTPTIYIDGREYDAKLDLDAWVDGEIVAAAKRDSAKREQGR